MQKDQAISLSTLNQMIGEATRNAFPTDIWIIAEILEMQVNRSGHCYLELVEKSGAQDGIIAKSRATIWSFKFRMIRSYFETTTGTVFAPGIKVMLRTEVSFHDVYGLSLNIKDIDPSYTMGDLALKRQEVLRKLRDAGVMDMNKEIDIEDLPRRIAIISSDTAAGYGDFLNTLQNNQYGFLFRLTLFPAIMQGESAEKSIINALEAIYTAEGEFDLVIIIRGGGSQADLNCFNGFDLAMNIAQFPIPVITGIGHDRDETVADLVAHRSIKTPTAVAEYLIDIMLDHLSYLEDLGEQLKHMVNNVLHNETLRLNQQVQNFQHLTKSYIQNQENRLQNFKRDLQQNTTILRKKEESYLFNATGKLKYLIKFYGDGKKQDLMTYTKVLKKGSSISISSRKLQLSAFEKSLELIKPENVLARGYSINSIDNKIVKSIKEIKKGDILTTRLKDGTFQSEVLDKSAK